jgi:DNA-binding response OmpR family regulator
MTRLRSSQYPLEHEASGAQARDGEEALRRFAGEHVDLVVLDLMLPKLDGLEVCRRLRAQSAVPIIMLTARDDELDKVVGLELGADDYITKPFSIREFRSRVRALLRRASLSATDGGRDLVTVDGLVLDLAKRTVDVRGTRCSSRSSSSSCCTLASRAGPCFSRRQLLERLRGGADYREPRTIDVHVAPSAREDRTERARAGTDPDRARRRPPLPRAVARMQRPVIKGIRLRLSLALVLVVAGVLAVVYLTVVPSLETELVNAKLDQLEEDARKDRSGLPDEPQRRPGFRRAGGRSFGARRHLHEARAHRPDSWGLEHDGLS